MPYLRMARDVLTRADERNSPGQVRTYASLVESRIERMHKSLGFQRGTREERIEEEEDDLINIVFGTAASLNG